MCLLLESPVIRQSRVVRPPGSTRRHHRGHPLPPATHPSPSGGVATHVGHAALVLRGENRVLLLLLLWVKVAGPREVLRGGRRGRGRGQRGAPPPPSLSSPRGGAAAVGPLRLLHLDWIGAGRAPERLPPDAHPVAVEAASGGGGGDNAGGGGRSPQPPDARLNKDLREVFGVKCFPSA